MTALIVLATVGPAFLTFYLFMRRWMPKATSEDDQIGVVIGSILCAMFWPLALTAFAATVEPRPIRRARLLAQEAELLAEREQHLGLSSSVPPSKETP